MGNCTSAHTDQGDPFKAKALFRNEIYRIPALIYIRDDRTFLAFAEKRTSFNDADATLLVIMRGTQQNQSVQWSPVQELKEAYLPGYRTMSPCPVYVKETKTIFLFFNCVRDKISEQQQIRERNNEARLCYVTSTDSGQTWSLIEDLTERVIGEEIKKWATFSVGPGHGIQMKSGRLIIPAYVYYIGFCSVKPYAFAFYSDDQGDTWHYGHRVNAESLECEMAEITNENGENYLYCNARTDSTYRVQALSNNRGEDFNPNLSPGKLNETSGGCQGSIVSFQHGDYETWLLYSHPTDKKKRKDLGVYLNKLDGGFSEWSKPYIINHGVSGYSDLTQVGDHFACLFECGDTQLENIAFVEFSLSDIMKNQ